MQLTVKDVAKLLNISEKTVYRMIQRSEIPVHRIGEQFRFDRIDLMEWATAKRINVSADLFKVPADTGEAPPLISDALTTGGIFYRLDGKDKEGALRSLVQVVSLPSDVDRGFLLNHLIAREGLASTGIGEGLAIPHVRNPAVFPAEQTVMALGFLEHPVDFGAPDGKPVYALFLLFSPSIRLHLKLLSQLSFLLNRAEVKAILARQASREDILGAIRHVEGELVAQEPPVSGVGL
ncbi:MAG: helix-turn-helix domain-containing protein [Verrucomicrobia bacterium]|nr:MAG: helix-turn-helix domain-containing protein [Verrucomicrobiota bacterium]